ncbi:hypothetical protein BKA70DRAFT_1268668, partial [Coprinopsis sp. MPI-PUGE-AT-0042]
TRLPQNGQTLTRVVVPTELIVEIMIMLVHSVRWMWAKREQLVRSTPQFWDRIVFHWKDLADPAAWLQKQVSNTRGEVPLALQAQRLSLHLPRRPEMPLLTSLTMKCVSLFTSCYASNLITCPRRNMGTLGYTLSEPRRRRFRTGQRGGTSIASESRGTTARRCTANCPNIEALEVEFIINRAYRCDHDGTFLTLLADQIGLVARWSNSLTTLTLNNTGGPPCALENLLYMCSALRHLTTLSRSSNPIRLEVLLDLWFVNSAQDFRMVCRTWQTFFPDLSTSEDTRRKKRSYPTASWSARIISKQYTVKRIRAGRIYTGEKRHIGHRIWD